MIIEYCKAFITAIPSKVYLEDPGHLLFEVNKACKEVFVLIPRFFKDLLQIKGLVRAATWKKTALSIFQFEFHYFTAFPFKV